MDSVIEIGTGTDLGFAGARVPTGMHICQIFSDDEERDLAMVKFLRAGLATRAKAACFSGNLAEDRLAAMVEQDGLSLAELRADGAFHRARSKDVYFQGGVFEPERMLALLTCFYESSLAEGFNGARVIGEMEREVLSTPGGNRLMEYEARVSVLVRQYPVTAMCQYDARSFDGATILDVLRVHPLMVVRDMVFQNPFCLSPEDVLATC